jgi:hypothetical protein
MNYNIMKYNISNLGKLLTGFALMLATFTACSDNDIDESTMIEFGVSDNTFTVSANAGHVDLELLSNQNCRLEFLEDTPWAEISVKNVSGDKKFYIDYDDNTEFPRMAKIIVRAIDVNLTDTIILRQKGLITPTVEVSAGSMVLNGATDGSQLETMETNLDFAEDVVPEVEYTGGDGEGWVKAVTQTADGRIRVVQPLTSTSTMVGAKLRQRQSSSLSATAIMSWVAKCRSAISSLCRKSVAM